MGSITNERSRQLSVDLSFLEDGVNYNATIYKDPIFGGWEAKPEEVEIINTQINNKRSYNIDLPSGGGQAIRFSPIT